MSNEDQAQEQSQQPPTGDKRRSSRGSSNGTSSRTKRSSASTAKSNGRAKAGTAAKKSTSTSKAKSKTRRAGSGQTLVIVESPTKARTIGKYLGRGYTVTASMGHVRDLPKSRLGVEVDSDFSPNYITPVDKRKLVKSLKEDVQGARAILLATDPDREGEAIAWHLIEATQPGDKPVQRIVFHEITPEAIKQALSEPRGIDEHLVDAYQARRVLDRLVGYEISPLLWRKVKRGLSAGRVQSVALRLVVEREREISDFVSQEYWSLDAELRKQRTKNPKLETFTASLFRVNGEKPVLNDEAATQAIVAALDGAAFQVASVETKETQRRPAAPFTTSTLQQEASRKLSMAVRRTMQTAQELYEGVDLGAEGTVGLITYMRTDSTNIAASAQSRAREVIAARYGPQFLPEKPPVYSRRSKGAQEAHEAIRPSDPAREPESLRQALGGPRSPKYRLYRLIWQRFIASQMRNAIFDSTRVDIDAGPANGDKPYRFRATGSVIKFPGFIAIYREGLDDDAVDEMDRDALPELTKDELLDLLRLIPEQHFTQPPPRYTEATLVKVMEEQGIGRPSTYASTIGTLQARNYVTIESRRLIPTELGTIVNDLLVEHFPGVVDTQFTSRMEEDLDEIASGDRRWVPVIRDFYGPFHETVQQADKNIGQVKVPDEPTDEICEKCGRPMVIKLGRYGRFVACSGFPECRNAHPLLEKTGVSCPSCREGEIVVKRSKKGRVFYGCSRYPECDFVLWDKPTGEVCPECGSLMVETRSRAGTGTKCSNPTCGYCGQRLEKTA
ncbi:MAG TPA: type I DNA topoisomerase [Thermomicrobiaceae bacterium]|nr:type I DNA topoisomerase [Thermomicrobiaceae bacterium]